MNSREDVWFLLSDLFVDTQWSDEELRRIGTALKETGYSPTEVEEILKAEVAPVCGRWMRWPCIGPWPGFDRAWLEEAIRKYLNRPRLPRFGLWGLPGVRRDWRIVREAMDGRADGRALPETQTGKRP